MARQLDTLQILRGVAATLVVFDHLVTACLSRVGRSDADLRGLWFAGAFGVEIFFCISGYIITQSLVSAGCESRSIVSFYQRRLIRVAPLYWLATATFGIHLTANGGAPAIDEWLQSLLFIPYADANGQMRPVLGLGWSLNFEMFFYIVLGQSLWLRSRLGPALLALTVLFPLWVVSLWLSGERLQQALPGGTWLLVSPVLGYFLAGVVLSYMAPLVERARLVRWPGIGAVAIMQTVLICGLVAVVLVQPSALSIAEPIAVVLAIGSVFVCALQPDCPERAGWLVGLSKRFGDASYSTYLSHAFVVGSMAALLVRVPLFSDLSAGGIAAICVLLLPLFNFVGLIVYFCVERPLLAFCNGRLLSARRPKA